MAAPKDHPKPSSTPTPAPAVEYGGDQENVVAYLTLIGSGGGNSANDVMVTVTNSTCSKVPNTAGHNLLFQWFDGSANDIQLYTDENCKNKGKPPPQKDVVGDADYELVEGTATVKPADYGGENWGSVQALGPLAIA